MIMLFLRVTVLFILFVKPLYYSPQKPDILYCNEVIRMGDHEGLKAVERLMNPLTLLYLDTAYAGHIVDWEFSQGFLKGHPDSAGYYILDLPGYTLDIASQTNNMHAVSRLLTYYGSVPRITRSDTIYRMYDQLYRFLPVFVGMKPFSRLLEGKLRKDFLEWERLSSITPPVKYPDPSVDFDRFLNLKPLSSRTDTRYMELILGLALQQMGSPGFSEEKIKELRKIQTCLGNKRFQLPRLNTKSMIFTEPIEKQIIPATKSYRNINELVDDKASMTLLISNWLTSHGFDQDIQYSQSKFLVRPPDKVYFEIYYEFGMQAIRLSLAGNRLIMIEKITEAID
jgi:hypothetical protein